jgi:hypothetical protein
MRGENMAGTSCTFAPTKYRSRPGIANAAPAYQMRKCSREKDADNFRGGKRTNAHNFAGILFYQIVLRFIIILRG